MGIIKRYVPESIPGIAQRVRVELTAAQVKALNSTPLTVIGAPGANKFISVDEVLGFVRFNSIAYTGANAVEFRYTNASGAKVTGDAAAAWLNSGAAAAVKAIAAAVTPVVNAPVTVSVPTANPGAGDSVVVLDILYRVVTLS